ncbi:MAG: amidase [Bacteroidota bacterium]
MEKFIYKSATELAQLIREGKASSTEIVQEHIERIKNLDGNLNAIVQLYEEEALKTAAECDNEAKQGNFRGPLHGVPVTIKECFWVKGKPSTLNFKMFRNFIAPRDAVIVDRIRKSGAVIIGKTNVPRNLTDHQVNGDIYPEGKNPYNTEYTPGGSTGGGAAALAAGFTPLETGNDIGGSVRIPANFCGLYGLKPTDRTIPLDGNMPRPKNAKTFLVHMAQPGPLARNPDDLELLWKVIVGPHESDRNIPRIEWKQPQKKSLSEYRIAWVCGWPGYQASHPVGDEIHTLIRKFESHGGKAFNQLPDETLHADSLKLWISIFPYVMTQGMPWYMRKVMKYMFRWTFAREFRIYNKEINRAFRMDANHYAEAMLNKSRVTERWEKFFGGYDFLVCPMAFGPAIKRCKIGTKITYDSQVIPYSHYVWPYVACFNASGHPAINIPLGIGKEGLPMGVQIVGPYWSEPELIHFAKLLSALTPGFVKPKGYENN